MNTETRLVPDALEAGLPTGEKPAEVQAAQKAKTAAKPRASGPEKRKKAVKAGAEKKSRPKEAAAVSKKPAAAAKKNGRFPPGASMKIVRRGMAAGLGLKAITEKLEKSGIVSGTPWAERAKTMVARVKHEAKNEKSER